MKISFSTLGCPRWTWQEITATAHDLGYDGVEVRGVGQDISAPSIPQFADENIAGTLEKLAKLKLAIPCLASEICFHLPETEERVARETEAYAILAKKLGAPYVRVMAAPAVPQPMGAPDEGFIKAEARKLGEIAGRHGVTLLIETNGVWANSEKLARLIEDVNSQNVAVLWDIHHPYRYFYESPETTYANIGKSVKHVHLKDSVAEGAHIRYAMPGFGDVPFEETVVLLKDKGYANFYSLEWVKRWDLTLEEPGIVFAHYASLMRSL
ncbi:MAG: sugar phosphate isomerase/epimerase [Oscillospiraceae bacterium]|jgi:fatty-acyl-CoA synthase|nr:sugar phosphate isomerase/epimerase [Oscillospiraceae bacterium]